MLKTTFNTIVITVFGCISLQTIALTQTTSDKKALISQTEATQPKVQNELPQQWNALYQISDRLTRANEQTRNTWLIELTSEHNHYAFADNSGIVNLDKNLLDKLSGDSSALACIIAHEMGHSIQEHEIVTEREQAEEIRRIRFEAEKEVKDRVNQEAQDSRRNSEAINSIGGLFGRDAERAIDGVGGILGSGNDVPDREKMFDEIYARKEQELKAGWAEKYEQQEFEADQIAYTYVAKAGYEPSGCIRGINAVATSSTSPAVESDEIASEPQQRIANIEQLITQYPPQTLASEGKAALENTEPLQYNLASDGTTLEISSGATTASSFVTTSSNSTTAPDNATATSVNSDSASTQVNQQPDGSNTDTAAPAESLSTSSANPELWARTRSYSDSDGYQHLVGRMAFSQQPFSGEASIGSGQVKFNSSDPIYARAYFDIPLNQALNLSYKTKERDDITSVGVQMWGKYGDRWHRMYNSNQNTSSFIMVVPQEQREKNYIDLDILPSPGAETSRVVDAGDELDSQRVGGFIDLLTKFDFERWHYENPGLEPISTYGFVINVGGAIGDLELYMTPEQLQALVNRKQQQETATAAQTASQTQLPDEFNTPLVPFKDPELSVENIKRMLSDRHEILKLAIGPGSADYTVGTGNYDADVEGVDVDVEYVNSQMTARNIWLAYRDTDGQCYFQTVTFQRDYLGGNRYGELREVWATVGENSSDPKAIACENIR